MTIDDLTKRQRQIAELMAQGMKTRQIAENLGLKEGNVSMQKTLMKRRLGVDNDEAVLALVAGVEPEPVEPLRKRTLYWKE